MERVFDDAPGATSLWGRCSEAHLRQASLALYLALAMIMIMIMRLHGVLVLALLITLPRTPAMYPYQCLWALVPLRIVPQAVKPQLGCLTIKLNNEAVVIEQPLSQTMTKTATLPSSEYKCGPEVPLYTYIQISVGPRHLVVITLA